MRFPTVVKLQHAAALAILSALGGCGFHLQGTGTLPPVLAKTYVVSTGGNVPEPCKWKPQPPSALKMASAAACCSLTTVRNLIWGAVIGVVAE